jgi:hypothetical protein
MSNNRKDDNVLDKDQKMKIFKDAGKLRITEIIKTKEGLFYYVEEDDKNKQVVTLNKLPGRTEIRCTCHNGTIYHNHSVLCKHKIAVIKHEFEVYND